MKTEVKSFGIHIKRECNSGDHTPFYAYNYNTKKGEIREINN